MHMTAQAIALSITPRSVSRRSEPHMSSILNNVASSAEWLTISRCLHAALLILACALSAPSGSYPNHCLHISLSLMTCFAEIAAR